MFLEGVSTFGFVAVRGKVEHFPSHEIFQDGGLIYFRKNKDLLW